METNNSQLVIYQTPQGETRIDVRVKGETIWLTQRQIAELFGTKVPAIFASGELQDDMVISKMGTTTRHGAIAGKTQTTETNFYNLDAILSVGYRVNSKNATAFRIWANQVLKQYLLQGYAINERVAAQKCDELSQLVKVLGRTIQNQEKQSKRRRPCFCISLLRATPSATATNALPPHCSYGSSTATAYFIMRTAPSASSTTPLSP